MWVVKLIVNFLAARRHQGRRLYCGHCGDRREVVHAPGDCEFGPEHGIILSGNEDHHADGSKLFEGMCN